MLNRPRYTSRAAGFTLVELSLVLVVIGLLLGAIKIGGDLQRQASYIRLISSHLSGWQDAYASFSGSQGYVVGGDADNPTTVDGADDKSNPDEVCGSDLTAAMLNAGVSLPTGRGVGSEDRYGYLDSNGNPQDLQVCFRNVDWAVPDGANTYKVERKNVMVIKYVTPDLARMIDANIDGLVDARFGDIRHPDFADVTNGHSQSWPKTNLDRFDGGAATNESQIAVMEVWWLMTP